MQPRSQNRSADGFPIRERQANHPQDDHNTGHHERQFVGVFIQPERVHPQAETAHDGSKRENSDHIAVERLC